MRAEKISIAQEIKGRLDEAEFFIIADYQGLTVLQTEELRTKLAANDARMMVLRNRQFTHVVNELDYEGFGTARIPGPTAMVYGRGDVVETSKVLKAFIKSMGKPVIKLGALQGKLISADDVTQLADLPNLDQMRGILVGTLAAPMTQVVGVMQQKLSSLVYVLNAAKEKKEASV